MEFSEKLELRNSCIDTMADFAAECEEITSVLVLGDDSTESLTVNLAVVVDEAENVRRVYGRIHYFVSNELGLESKKTLRREDNFVLIEYTLESGVIMTVLVCTCAELFDAPWWRCVFDNTGDSTAAMKAETRVEEDILSDEPQPEMEPEPEEEPEPEPVFEVVPDPEEPPAPVEEPEEEEEEEPDEDEAYWNFVSNSIRTAKHAIASGAYIRATEIINTLRKMLIELICVRNGINENFEHAIDFVDCEEKDLLIKTYPNGTDKTSLISALAVETELFDKLA